MKRVLVGLVLIWLVGFGAEPEWLQLRVFDPDGTVEINFPVKLLVQSTSLMPKEARLKIDEEEIDLNELLSEISEEEEPLLELETDSARVDIRVVDRAKVVSPSHNRPKNFVIVAQDRDGDSFHLRIQLKLFRLILRWLPDEDSEEAAQFFEEVVNILSEPGRYCLIRVSAPDEWLEVSME
jgi:hypothetical protein